MTISLTLSPADATPKSLTSYTVTWAGLAATTKYTWSVAGPQGTQQGSMTSDGGGAATTTWFPDGGGNYVFNTQLIGAVTAVPSESLTVAAIN